MGEVLTVSPFPQSVGAPIYIAIQNFRENLCESERCIDALKKRRRVLKKRGRVLKKRGRVP